MPNETWKSVVGYEGFYEVSDQGNVRSLDRTILFGPSHDRRGNPVKQHERFYRGKPIKPIRHKKNGYHYLSLSRPRVEPYRATVHSLVAQAFLGPCPLGMMVSHADDIGTNNALSNLSYATYSENGKNYYHNTRHTNKKRTAL